MPKRLNKLLICLIAIALAVLAPPARAQDFAAIVVDARSGAVLLSIDAHARWYPASLTKVMTVYLALEAIEAGTLRLDEELTVSEHAASQSPTELGVGAGDKIKVEEAILAIILQSANDVAVVVAERLGGTEEAFAKMMTAKAQALGMARTQFRNATGLPDPDQVTTARDMAMLGKALLDNFPQHYHFFSAKSFTYAGHTFDTINGILSRYPGADGIKTGFTAVPAIIFLRLRCATTGG
jgi:D-alanyl-D-alanine carboxypeptidase